MVYWSAVLSLIALSSSGVKVLVALPLLTISANVIDFFDLADAIAEFPARASSPAGTPIEAAAASVNAMTPRGARAAHRIEVHHRAPAAAGNLRAEHGVVELRIVGRKTEPACPSSSTRVLRRRSAPWCEAMCWPMSALPQVTVTMPSGAIEYQTLGIEVGALRRTPDRAQQAGHRGIAERETCRGGCRPGTSGG